MYQSLIRPLLFRLSAEKAHYFTFGSLRFLHALPGFSALTRALYHKEDPRLKVKVFGLEFSNPVGLAAGFDKDAKLFQQLAHYGFGFIEVGTVTPQAQPGNAKPRLFRLPKDQALINRMGFNNEGLSAMVGRLQKARRSGLLIGGNIGKNKATPNDEAWEDYQRCFKGLHPYVDYFVVNVSSPNTPNLRALQEKEPLTELLNALVVLNRAAHRAKPILLKIAPDLSEAQLDDIIEIVEASGIDGLIATNTTINRSDLKTEKTTVEAMGAGGLSGKPLRDRATEVIRYLHEKSEGRIPIIAVGGIFTAEDAREKLAAGAKLVQVYTGFIYEGPGMVKRILNGLSQQ